MNGSVVVNKVDLLIDVYERLINVGGLIEFLSCFLVLYILRTLIRRLWCSGIDKLKGF